MHRAQLRVQCLAQGHVDMQTGGTREQTTNLPVDALLYILSHSHVA